jgi:hypothetical protein
LSFGIDYTQLQAVKENNIAALSVSSSQESIALVALAAYQLQAIGLPPSNLSTLVSIQQALINSLSTGSGLDSVAIQAASAIPRKSVVWRVQEFLADGTFTAPDNLAGDVVYITGCGGGGSGAARNADPADIALSTGGSGGFYCLKRPLPVTIGTSYAVTIGGGAAAVVSAYATTANGAAGSATTFGALLALSGGTGGRASDPLTTQPRGGFNAGSVYLGYSSTTLAANTTIWLNDSENSEGYKGGAFKASTRVLSTGGGGGLFGNGGDAQALSGITGAADSAIANSGGGGGGCSITSSSGAGLTATSGAGGSGRLIIEWQEYL